MNDTLLLQIVYIMTVLTAIIANAGKSKAETVTKLAPLSVLVIYIVTIIVSKTGGNSGMFLLIGALLCGMAGDYFLVREKERFRSGLMAFLAGHIVYSVIFFSSFTFTPVYLLITIPAFLSLLPIFKVMKKDEFKRYAIPILVYTGAITVMAVSAVWYGIKNDVFIELALGGVLFLVSDAVLTFHLFIRKIKGAYILIYSSYFGAQYFLATGVLMSFGL